MRIDVFTEARLSGNVLVRPFDSFDGSEVTVNSNVPCWIAGVLLLVEIGYVCGEGNLHDAIDFNLPHTIMGECLGCQKQCCENCLGHVGSIKQVCARIGNTQPCIGTFADFHMHIRTIIDWLLRILLIVRQYYYLYATRLLTSLYDVVTVDLTRTTASLLPQALFGDSACDGTRSR